MWSEERELRTTSTIVSCSGARSISCGQTRSSPHRRCGCCYWFSPRRCRSPLPPPMLLLSSLLLLLSSGRRRRRRCWWSWNNRAAVATSLLALPRIHTKWVNERVERAWGNNWTQEEVRAKSSSITQQAMPVELLCVGGSLQLLLATEEKSVLGWDHHPRSC